MNFKQITIVASLFAAAIPSFAADIDLGGQAVISTPLVGATFLPTLDSSLTLGDVTAGNNAVILQDVSLGDSEQVAVIDQIGTLGGLAVIVQQGSLGGIANVAYIQQNGTTNNRAVIAQR